MVNKPLSNKLTNCAFTEIALKMAKVQYKKEISDFIWINSMRIAWIILGIIVVINIVRSNNPGVTIKEFIKYLLNSCFK